MRYSSVSVPGWEQEKCLQVLYMCGNKTQHFERLRNDVWGPEEYVRSDRLAIATSTASGLLDILPRTCIECEVQYVEIVELQIVLVQPRLLRQGM